MKTPRNQKGLKNIWIKNHQETTC